MKQFFVCFSALLAALLISCGDSKGKEQLNLYIWGDYISPDVIALFEQENNCKIKIDVFDSNESMYAKLKAGATGYDVVVPSSYMARLMYKQGLLADLDPVKLPNVVQFHDRSYSVLSLDGGMQYTVPYFVSFTGIGYNSERLKDFQPSWRQFEREDIKKRCTLLDDQREVIGAALRTLGYDVNTTSEEQINAAVELIKKWKQNIAKFAVDDAKEAIANGSFLMVQNYNGDILQVAMENPAIKFVIPKEGSTVTFDNFAIMKNSKKIDLAHKFIDFMYRTEVATANMNEILYLMPHKEAVHMVKDELKNNPAFNLPLEDRSRCIPLRDMGTDQQLYTSAWDRIKAE